MGLFGKKKTNIDVNVDYDEDADYSVLEQHTYKDSPVYIFYTSFDYSQGAAYLEEADEEFCDDEIIDWDIVEV